jgi:hypothetical protein
LTTVARSINTDEPSQTPPTIGKEPAFMVYSHGNQFVGTTSVPKYIHIGKLTPMIESCNMKFIGLLDVLLYVAAFDYISSSLFFLQTVS